MKNNNNIKKPSILKCLILIGIVIVVCEIAILIIISSPSYKEYDLSVLNKSQGEEKQEQKLLDEEVKMDESSSLVTTVAESENKEEYLEVLAKELDEDSHDELDFDVEAEVEQIRLWYYSPTEREEKFVLNNGTEDWNYSREYSFHDGILFFAFVFNGTEEHRLYFKDGVMIRYIDENKNVFDYGNTSYYSDWEVRVIAESKQFYE